MRLVSWLGGLLLIAVLGATVGALWLGHAQTPKPLTLTAARYQAVQAPVAGTRFAPSTAINLNALRPSPSPPPAPPPAAPRASIVVGSTQQALINGDRARNGLGPLTWSGCLYSVAVANARRIAAQGYLSHTNGPSADLSCGLGHQAGENIGWYSGGANDAWMNSAFMASPEHYANIMGPYHYVATAWVVSADGKGWIAVEFG